MNIEIYMSIIFTNKIVSRCFFLVETGRRRARICWTRANPKRTESRRSPPADVWQDPPRKLARSLDFFRPLTAYLRLQDVLWSHGPGTLPRSQVFTAESKAGRRERKIIWQIRPKKMLKHFFLGVFFVAIFFFIELECCCTDLGPGTR